MRLPKVIELLAIILLAGCPSEEKSLNFVLQQYNSVRCDDNITGLVQGKYKIRLTFMKRPEGASIGVTNLRDFDPVCDLVVGDSQDVEFGIESEGPLDIRVEAFDRVTNDLRWYGEALAADIWSDIVTVNLRQAGMSCRMDAKRLHAFHSATLLPNGQVLLVGGITNDSDGEKLGDAAIALANKDPVEIFDPYTNAFHTPSGANDIPSRAFHRAVLLASPAQGPYSVLLIGGLTSSDASKPILKLKQKQYTQSNPFLFAPHEEAEAAGAGIVDITLDEDGKAAALAYRPVPKIPPVMFPATALNHAASELLVVPGATAFTGPGGGFSGEPSAFWVSLANQSVGDQVTMERIRVGHAVARLGKDRYYIVGGAMDSPAAGEENPEPFFVAARVMEGAGKVENVSGMTGWGFPTAWHTLIPIGQSDRDLKQSPPTSALWTGGFGLKKETDNLRFSVEFDGDPRIQQLIFDDPENSSSLLVQDRSNDNAEVTHTAYHDAVRLHDGSVMVSGGNRPTESGIFGASNQVFIARLGKQFDVDTSTFQEGLVVPRYGHRSVRLLDNSILITGGITSDPEVTTAAEIFMPRVGDPSEDYPFGRQPAEAKYQCEVFSKDGDSTTQSLSSAMVTLTRPDPRTKNSRRRRAVRGPARRARLRIDFGTPTR